MAVALTAILAIRLQSNGDDDAPANTADAVTTSTSATATTAKGEPATTSTAKGEPKPTKSLTKALLTNGDLPDGWTSTGRTTITAQLCPGHDPAKKVPAKAADSAGFAKGDSGPFLSSIVQEFSSEQAARSFLATSRAEVAACSSYSLDGVSYRLTVKAVPDVGDESLGAELVGTGETARVFGRILYSRVGDRVATIVFAGTGTGLDPAPATEALRTVAGRL